MPTLTQKVISNFLYSRKIRSMWYLSTVKYTHNYLCSYKFHVELLAVTKWEAKLKYCIFWNTESLFSESIEFSPVGFFYFYNSRIPISTGLLWKATVPAVNSMDICRSKNGQHTWEWLTRPANSSMFYTGRIWSPSRLSWHIPLSKSILL